MGAGVLLAGCIITGSAHAGPAPIAYTVTSCEGTRASGTLPDVIAAANSASTGPGFAAKITFSATCNLAHTISLNGPLILANSGTYTIIGNGQDQTLIDGSGGSVFAISRGAHVALSGMTLLNGQGIQMSNAATLSVDDAATLSVDHLTFSTSIGNAIAATTTSTGALSVSNSQFLNSSGSQSGGAISDAGSGSATVTNSTFSSNSATTNGGAIDISGAATMQVSGATFDHNTATSGRGGAIEIAKQASVTVTRTTFFANSAASAGSAIDNSAGGALILEHTTFLGNTGVGAAIAATGNTHTQLAGSVLAGNSGGDCSGTITDGGFNISDDLSCHWPSSGTSSADLSSTPSLVSTFGPLQDNGGVTRTLRPLPGSPVIGKIPVNATVLIDAINVPACPSTDQRGATTPGPCDIGATLGQVPITITAAPSSKTYNGNDVAPGVPQLTAGHLFAGDAIHIDHLVCAQHFNAISPILATQTNAVCAVIDGAGINATSRYAITYVAGVGSVRPNIIHLSSATPRTGSSLRFIVVGLTPHQLITIRCASRRLTLTRVFRAQASYQSIGLLLKTRNAKKIPRGHYTLTLTIRSGAQVASTTLELRVI